MATTQGQRPHTAAKTSSSKKKKKKNSKRTRVRVIVLVIEIIVLAFLLLFLYGYSKLSLIEYDEIETPIEKNELTEETEQMLKGYTTIALFGVDNRSNGNYDTGNSDVIMIVAIDNDSNQVRLMSVYRDTSLDIDGTGTIRKANYAYNHGGAANAIEMLNRNLDLDIQDYVCVDFKALADAVDALGGVELDITDAEIAGAGGLSLNSYINEVAAITGKTANPIWSSGTQLCDGVQATAYCRIRFTGAGDLDRAGRQRVVLSKLVEKAKHANPAELNRLVTAIFPEVQTSLSLTEILGLAAGLAGYELNGTAGFPFSMQTATLSQEIGSVDIPCTLEDNVRAMYYYLYDDSEHNCSVTVQNISDRLVNISGFTASSAIDYGYQTIDELMAVWAASRGEGGVPADGEGAE